MDISFANRKLAKTFSEEKQLVRAYGQITAEKIKLRMALLRAAPNLAQVPTEKPARRHQLKGDLDGSFAVDLAHPFRLVFSPAIDPIPKKDDGGIDLERVTAIEINDVTDYH